ncbi:MAG: sensor histidine kinase [Deltaproteobacteria bacterium]|nr:sensor histidine kinase [Deltaproteobacteria bacterium]
MSNEFNKNVASFFAPAERSSLERLAELSKFSVNDPVIKAILDSVGGFVLILNEQRQVLAANDEVLEALELESAAPVVGLRPGEILGCSNVAEAPGGCGTAKGCRYCGAVLSILSSQQGQSPATGECLLLAEREEQIVAAEYRVRATPIRIRGESLTVFVLISINDEKRRSALERVFFHDAANLLGGLIALSQTIRDCVPANAARQILALSKSLTQEMQSHRILMEAERGNLKLHQTTQSARDVIDDVLNLFHSHHVAAGKRLEVDTPDEELHISCDHSLLQRVLINMVKNAYEATPVDGVVRMWAGTRDGRPGFIVSNQEPIPDEIGAMIFKRSFSTKGNNGRGLGTYSMKLLGEQYLEGEVWFTSDPDEGTRFGFFLPASVKTTG